MQVLVRCDKLKNKNLFSSALRKLESGNSCFLFAYLYLLSNLDEFTSSSTTSWIRWYKYPNCFHQLKVAFSAFIKPSINENAWNTVKPRPEAHMDMILFEVFLKSMDLIPQQQILQRHYLYYR